MIIFSSHTLAAKRIKPFDNHGIKAGVLSDAVKEKILVFDQCRNSKTQLPEDFPDNKDGFNDGLSLTHPEWIVKIHEKSSKLWS